VGRRPFSRPHLICYVLLYLRLRFGEEMKKWTASHGSRKVAGWKGLGVITGTICLCVTSLYGFTSAQVDQVKKTNKCEGCDLSGANLLNASLNDAMLSGAKMAGAMMTGADLFSANLSGADLSRADLSRADLVAANFSKANLSAANLAGSRLSWARLTDADLSRANLTGADLRAADLKGAKLSHAKWTDGRVCQEGSVGECKPETVQPAQGVKPGRGSGTPLQSPAGSPAGM